MTRWEYEITLHQIPETPQASQEQVIQCDQDGLCFVHDTFRSGIQWLETLFKKRGEEGWELVQSGYHRRELLCIWKKPRNPAKAD
ncbi:MAG: hypothetical protein N3G78_08155 [Desulfobacterota bacterium]|nr:hypothetical protein [Thermodesulfobacteriota bacterium]